MVLLHDATCWHVPFAAHVKPAPQLASLAPLHTPAHACLAPLVAVELHGGSK